MRCIDLLDEEYTSLIYTIVIYLDREKLEYERINKPIFDDDRYQHILNNDEIIGQNISDKRLIHLYLFNLDNMGDKNKRKLEIVANLFHEIRHAWQCKNGLFPDEEQINDIKTNKETYLNQDSERDAYLFQKEIINKHKCSIAEIMEISGIIQDCTFKPGILD